MTHFRPPKRSRPARVALLPWGNVIEDYLDTIGVTLEEFGTRFTGSWMFGYAHSLAAAGIDTIIICFSSRVDAPTHFHHGSSGATVLVLPSSRLYRLIERQMTKPYRRSARQAFHDMRGVRLLLLPLFALVHEVAFYAVTPLRQLAHHLHAEGCTAILCQEYEYPRFDSCVVVGHMTRLPVYATFQGGDYQRMRAERVIRPFAIRRCAGLIIAPRREIARVKQHYGVPDDRITAIFNPVDQTVWHAEDRQRARDDLALSSDTRVVIWHGRVSITQKGLDVLLQAWDQVRAEWSGDLRLVLIGSGQDDETLRQLIGNQDTITWIDRFVHDQATMRRRLSAADVYVFPSRHEGFAVAPLEAMACGLPVVAAAASGIAETFVDGEASGGIIVPVDDASALAAALLRLLHDDHLRAEMGRNAARRIADAFSLDAVGAQLRALLAPNTP